MKKKFSINNTNLKYIAAVLMFVDHFALFLVTDSTLQVILRTLARPSALLFFFSVSIGIRKTRNPRKYILLMLLLGLAFQLAYVFFDGIDFLTSDKNIMFTLALGAISLYVLKRSKLPKWLGVVLVIPILLFANIFNVDYASYGVLLIIVLGFYEDIKFVYIAFLVILVNAFYYFLNYLPFSMGSIISNIPIVGNIYSIPLIQLFSIVGLLGIYLYNGERGRGHKYFFYIFYPVHIAILEIIATLLNRGI